jgi:hypothetical protein
MPSRVPAPRQHITRITRGLRFLGHPTPSGLPAWSPAPVSVRAPDGFPRPGCPFFVALGRYFTPCPSHRADALGALNQDRMGTIPVWACLSAALAGSVRAQRRCAPTALHPHLRFRCPLSPAGGVIACGWRFIPFSPSHSAVCSPGTQRRVMRSLLCQEVRSW